MNEETKKAVLDRLKYLAAKDLHEEASDVLEKLHEADVADLLEGLSQEERIAIFSLLPLEHATETLMELEEPERAHILGTLTTEQLTDLVDGLESDEATDIVAKLEPEVAEEVLSGLDEESSLEVRRLLLYPEESAGGIMQLELISAREDESSGELLDRLRGMEEPLEDVSNIFIVDGRHRYLGRVPLYKLLRLDPDRPLREAMQTDVPPVPVELDREDVARHFQRYDLVSAPVVDDEKHLLGRITIDDIVEVIEDEVSEDFLMMGGTHKDELLYTDRPMKVAGVRLPWLLVNLLGGLLTGYLLWLFKVTLESALALVTFIPVITAMGGNAGIQSSTIMVRMLALGKMEYGSTLKAIMKEVRVSLFMGPACGLVVGLAAELWHGHPSLGLLVAIAMTACIMAATFMGTLVPVVFDRLNIDPALAAGPFVTTANDITGILIYLSIATAFLRFVTL